MLNISHSLMTLHKQNPWKKH
ncbi:hypothetical protein RDI58_010148 [Solanum bulbocastanum]|uniref:Uncharacterized protein n=1 Tax=Solanum bulbocastanum TaxID=147425 RepID=A0AAN8YG34_SOLBU